MSRRQIFWKFILFLGNWVCPQCQPDSVKEFEQNGSTKEPFKESYAEKIQMLEDELKLKTIALSKAESKVEELLSKFSYVVSSSELRQVGHFSSKNFLNPL